MNDGEPVIAPFGSVSLGLLHGLCGLHGFGFIAGAGPRRRPHEAPDFLSNDKGRRALHLLPGGWAKRRADAPLSARRPFVIADVRAAVRPAVRPLPYGRADYPGFGHSDWPDPKAFNYTFDHIASVMDDFVQSIGLSRYTLYMQDYGGPVGFRMALKYPERVEALIVQNAVAHNEGLGAIWKTRRAFLGGSGGERKRVSRQFPLARHDPHPPSRRRSEYRALRPGSLDGRIRVL